MKRGYAPLVVVGVLLAAAFLWSLWSETLYPLIRQGDTLGVVAHLVGVPIILVGVGFIIYGGLRVVQNMFTLMGDEQVLQNTAVMKKQSSPAATRRARLANLRLWATAFVRGAKWMGLGFLLIAVGGYIINL